jgi:hypothetical protein
MPPRGKPPRSTVSSPGTPVGMRLSSGLPDSSVGMVCATGRSGNLTVNAEPAPRRLETLISPCIARELACYPQADAKPAIVFHSARAMKTLENQRLVAIRNADPLVANRQPGQLAIARQRDLDGSPQSEANGIGKQDFPRSARPPLGRIVRSPLFNGELNLAAGALRQRKHVRRDLPDQRREVDLGGLQVQFPGIDAGHLE